MNKAFVLYTEYNTKFKRLSDEQLGKLLRMIFAYEETGEMPESDDPVVSIVFDFIQPDLEKQYQKYQAKVSAGKKSGEQRRRTESNKVEQNETKQSKTKLPLKDVPEIKEECLYGSNIYAPQLIDVQEFFALKGFETDPETFFYHYDATNWRVGGENIKDWKKLAMSWEASAKQKNRKAKQEAWSFNDL